MLPIGARLRLQKKKPKSTQNSEKLEVKILSLDEEIALLEQSLNSDSNTEFDDPNYEINVENPPRIEKLDDHLLVEKDENGNILKLVSSSILDRIEPLPKSLLPEPPPKKRKRDENTYHDIPQKLKSSTKVINSASGPLIDKRKGLEMTIREMLRNYEPASLEKKPFYCRVCRFQGKDLVEFNTHRNSEEHHIAIDIEAKMSYCKLCRKQFTSPLQLREHLNSKPHKEKLEYVKQKQQSRIKIS